MSESLLDLRKLDVGYLSGIIDGEGCFTIRFHIRETKHLGKRVRFQPQLVICNSDLKIIEKVEGILNFFGINYTKYKRDRTKLNPNAKMQWHLIIFSNGLKVLIPLTKNYIAKKREAEILEEVLNKKKRKGGGSPYTNKELKQMDKFRQELISLHGNQAKKLAKNVASVYSVSNKKLNNYMEKRRKNAKDIAKHRYSK